MYSFKSYSACIVALGAFLVSVSFYLRPSPLTETFDDEYDYIIGKQLVCESFFIFDFFPVCLGFALQQSLLWL